MATQLTVIPTASDGKSGVRHFGGGGSKKTAAVDVRLDPKEGLGGGAVTPALLTTAAVASV
jgi:hypothetical protein